jgi:uncharacterized membrane protein
MVSLASWCILFTAQLSLLWPDFEIDLYWILLLAVPLLLPLPGLWRDRLYTYRWVGFMTLIYLCIGISESVANPELRSYGLVTAVSSITLFLASIYYARYLRLQQHQS